MFWMNSNLSTSVDISPNIDAFMLGMASTMKHGRKMRRFTTRDYLSGRDFSLMVEKTEEALDRALSFGGSSECLKYARGAIRRFRAYCRNIPNVFAPYIFHEVKTLDILYKDVELFFSGDDCLSQ